MKRVSIFRCLVFLCMFSLFARMGVCMELKTNAFSEGGLIPLKHTGLSSDVSPELAWSDAPEGVKSFVLIMDDPDAPMGTWVHWVVYDIPSSSSGLEEGVPKQAVLGDGTKQGVTSFREVGYGGPNPPPGKPHRYIFTLYALDAVLNMEPGADKSKVLKAIKGHVLDEATLTGKFGR